MRSRFLSPGRIRERASVLQMTRSPLHLCSVSTWCRGGRGMIPRRPRPRRSVDAPSRRRRARTRPLAARRPRYAARRSRSGCIHENERQLVWRYVRGALWAAFSGAPSRQGHYVWSLLRKYQRFRAAVRILTDRLNPYLLRLFFISSVTRALGALGVWSVRFMVTVGVVVAWCFVFNVAVVTIALFCPVLR